MFSLFNRFKVRFGKGRGSRHIIKFQYEVKVALLLDLQGCFVNRALFIQSKNGLFGSSNLGCSENPSTYTLLSA